MYSCHLVLISSASLISVLDCAHLWMKYSFDISNFPEEISSLSPSIFLCFHYSLEKAFLSLLLFSGTLHLVGCNFPFLPCFLLLFLPQLFVKPPQTTTLPSCKENFFFFGMVLFAASCTVLRTSVQGILFTRSNPLNLSVTST